MRESANEVHDMKRKRIAGCRAVAAVFCLFGTAGCSWLGLGGLDASVKSQWEVTATRRLAANELWKEHNGGDQIYIEFGCISETMKDYRHCSRPWAIHSSVFDQSKPDGARELFGYYREGIDDPIPDIERIGDASYLWAPSGMRCWTLGFRKGRYFVEISLSDESPTERPLTQDSRNALLELARQLADSL